MPFYLSRDGSKHYQYTRAGLVHPKQAIQCHHTNHNRADPPSGICGESYKSGEGQPKILVQTHPQSEIKDKILQSIPCPHDIIYGIYVF